MGHIIIGIVIFVAIICVVVFFLRLVVSYFVTIFESAKEILTGDIVTGGCSCIIMLILGVLGAIVLYATIIAVFELLLEG